MKAIIDATEYKKINGKEVIFAVTIDGKEMFSSPHFETAYFFLYGYLKALKLDFFDNKIITEKARYYAKKLLGNK